MDLLTSIFAYLGTVTAIIVAVVMSYDAFIYTPLHSRNPQHNLMVEAKPTTAAKAALSTSANKIAPTRLPVASLSRGAAPARAAQQMDIAAERRAAYLHREAARQKRMRRLARQARDREWASQQAPSALSYANEPPEGLYNAFPYQ
jgi:Tfp pilus assembly protein FimV